MNVLLINPTISEKNIWNQSIPHIGIGYIAAVLKQNGYKVDILDFPSMDLNVNDVMSHIKKRKYDAVGISLYFYNKLVARKIVKKIKRSIDCFIFLGGYYPTLSTSKTFEIFPEADCLIIGEGEVTTLDLIEHLEKKDDWHNISGIAYVVDGMVVSNEYRALVANLDMLPFPVRPTGINMKYLPIITSRGCYGRCSFCGVMEFYLCNTGARRRFRSVENVIFEIKALIAENNTECIIINDETFFDASKKRQMWLEEFINKLLSNNINVTFQCQARANDVLYNYQSIESMTKHGMTRLFIGLESFTQRQLDFYQKDLSVDTNIQAVKLLHNLNTQIFFGFILFDPLITLDEITMNIEIIRSIKLCAIASPEEQRPFSMSVLLLIEGTKLYDVVQEMNLSRNNERGYIFKYSEVEHLYSLLQQWHRYLDLICRYMFHIFFIRDSNSDTYEKLILLKRQFLELDLDFMNNLCILIKNKVDEETIQDKSRSYYIRIDEITIKFMDLLELPFQTM